MSTTIVRRFGWLIVVAAMTLAGARMASVAAQDGVSLLSQDARNRFPDDLSFQMEVESPVPIVGVELRYTILPDGVATRAPARCTPDEGTRVACTAIVEGNDPPRVYLPPFTEVRYSWLVTDESGAVSETPESSIVYDDTQFGWEETTSDGLVVYTYGGTDPRPLVAAARASLDRMTSLLAAEVGFPVKVVVYNSRGDMQAALQRRSEGFSERVITLGVRVSSDTVIVLNNAGVESTLQHELAHVVTKQAGEGGLGFIPAWLDEGTAVLAQDAPGRSYESAFEAAVSGDSLLSLRATSSATGNPSDVDLFYGQSWAFVSYLVDEFGEERYAELFATFKRGATADEALTAVYGKDLRTLENEWRASLGLGPRTAGPSRNETDVQGTLTPFGVGGIAEGDATAAPDGNGRDESASDDDGGSDGVLIAVIAVAGIAAAGAVAGGSVAVARRRREHDGG